MRKRIVLLEDIDEMADWLSKRVRTIAPEAELEHFRTESEFIAAFDRIRTSKTDLFLIDMMVPWAEPSPSMPPTPEGYAGYRRAGLRCVHLLLDDSRTAQTPIIINTVLEDGDMEGEIPTQVTVVTKEVDPDNLMEKIKTSLRI